jgi:hypothetical protein
MAKYKEVLDKQEALERMADREGKMDKQLFVGFTFRYVGVFILLTFNTLTFKIDIANPLSTKTASLPALASHSAMWTRASEPSSRMGKTCTSRLPGIFRFSSALAAYSY